MTKMDKIWYMEKIIEFQKRIINSQENVINCQDKMIDERDETIMALRKRINELEAQSAT